MTVQWKKLRKKCSNQFCDVFIISSHVLYVINYFLAFGAANTDIAAIQDVINDRLNLTLAQVISRIQRDLEERNYEGVGVPVKTVCERYYGGTAVSQNFAVVYFLIAA